MKKIIIKNAIKREKGKLYYLDGKGNLCEAKLKRGRKKGQTNKIIKLSGNEKYF